MIQNQVPSLKAPGVSRQKARCQSGVQGSKEEKLQKHARRSNGVVQSYPPWASGSQSPARVSTQLHNPTNIRTDRLSQPEIQDLLELLQGLHLMRSIADHSRATRCKLHPKAPPSTAPIGQKCSSGSLLLILLLLMAIYHCHHVFGHVL